MQQLNQLKLHSEGRAWMAPANSCIGKLSRQFAFCLLLVGCQMLVPSNLPEGFADSFRRLTGMLEQKTDSLGNATSNNRTDSRSRNGSCGARIPRILHYIFASENVYSNCSKFKKQCLALNPDWQVYLWRDADGERLIKDHYPSFVAKFTGYQGDLQKSDAVRYAVLHRFGGVYLDMDIECSQPLFPRLLDLTAFIDRDRWEQTVLLFSEPTMIMNSAMGSVPGHPFFLYILDKLKSIQGQHPVFSTGPVALTNIYQDWLRSAEAKKAPAVTVLPSQVLSGLIDQNNPAVLSPCKKLPPEFSASSPSPAERRKLSAELSGFDIDRLETHRGRDPRRMACASLALTDWRRGLHDNRTVGVHRFLHLGYGFAASQRGPKFNLLSRFSRVQLHDHSKPSC